MPSLSGSDDGVDDDGMEKLMNANNNQQDQENNSSHQHYHQHRYTFPTTFTIYSKLVV